MNQEYYFYGVQSYEPVSFDDEGTVAELIQCAFHKYGYEEPLGMDIVTVFQCHHPADNEGWFTTDVTRKCRNEIVNRKELCFAYYLPGVFYFAEGGWGHHMISLGNHPVLENPVSVSLVLEEMRQNSVVINGRFTMRDVIRYLQSGGYISQNINRLFIRYIGSLNDLIIPWDDGRLDLKLTEFSEEMDEKMPSLAYYWVIHFQ